MGRVIASRGESELESVESQSYSQRQWGESESVGRESESVGRVRVSWESQSQW